MSAGSGAPPMGAQRDLRRWRDPGSSGPLVHFDALRPRLAPGSHAQALQVAITEEAFGAIAEVSIEDAAGELIAELQARTLRAPSLMATFTWDGLELDGSPARP